MSDRAIRRAGSLGDERPSLLDYRTGLTERQREHLNALLAADQRPPSPAETLEELERDTRAGRTVKLDLRLAPDEKVAWSEAARAKRDDDERVDARGAESGRARSPRQHVVAGDWGSALRAHRARPRERLKRTPRNLSMRRPRCLILRPTTL
jgi:hypothetical protein